MTWKNFSILGVTFLVRLPFKGRRVPVENMKSSRFSPSQPSSQESLAMVPGPDLTEFSPEMQIQIESARSLVRECLEKSKGKEADPNHLLPFTRKILHQHRIYGLKEEKEIISEAFYRTIIAIEKGKKIENLPAWFRGTIINIIREERKDCSRLQSLAYKIKSEDNNYNLVDNEVHNYSIIDDNISKLYDALNFLSDEEVKVLVLRHVRGLSWQEIGEHFSPLEREEIGEKKMQARWRQKGKRALDKLRRFYRL